MTASKPDIPSDGVPGIIPQARGRQAVHRVRGVNHWRVSQMEAGLECGTLVLEEHGKSYYFLAGISAGEIKSILGGDIADKAHWHCRFVASERQRDRYDRVLDVVTMVDDRVTATRVTGPSDMDAVEAVWAAMFYHDQQSAPVHVINAPPVVVGPIALIPREEFGSGNYWDSTYSITGAPPENLDVEDGDILHTDVIDLDRGTSHITLTRN